MKKTPNFRLARFTLLLLAGSLCVGRVTAQAGEPVSAGKFTLPFEVRWGQAVLTGVRLHVGHDSASCVRGARTPVEEGAGGFTLPRRHASPATGYGCAWTRRSGCRCNVLPGRT